MTEEIINIIMLIATFVYSYLILYCKRSSFVFGVIASGIMAYTLIKSGIYIQAILHCIYVLMYTYSFFRWGGKESPKISNITRNVIITSGVSIIAFTCIMGYAFNKMGTIYPYIDAFSAVCSMTAVLLLSKKVIEHSYIFVASNIASISICYLTRDYITIISFIVYMLFNIIRVFVWKKMIKDEKTNILNEEGINDRDI